MRSVVPSLSTLPSRGVEGKAVGDLDGDGELSADELRGRITDSGELDIDRDPLAPP